MKFDAEKLGQYAPLLIVGIAVLGFIWYVSSSQASASTYSTNTIAAPDPATTQAAIAAQAQANSNATQLAESAQQTIGQEFAAVLASDNTYQQGLLAVQADQIGATAATAQTQIQANAATALGEIQNNVDTVQANDQLSSIQAQAKAAQTASFWNSLFGAVGTVGSAAATGGASSLFTRPSGGTYNPPASTGSWSGGGWLPTGIGAY